MPVNGVDHSVASPSPDPSRHLQDSRDGPAPYHAHDGAAAASDRVEISDTARDLSGQDTSEASGPTAVSAVTRPFDISPERIQAVLSRVDNGFYESTSIRDQIVHRILPDLRSLTTG